jgi:hypothetical protein
MRRTAVLETCAPSVARILPLPRGTSCAGEISAGPLERSAQPPKNMIYVGRSSRSLLRALSGIAALHDLASMLRIRR